MTEASTNFIRNIINNDLQSNKHGGRVATRFPPEPNGYLHIGHAKSICLNFGLAQKIEGASCNLRFDDTNPANEDVEYVHAIKSDVNWLGFMWDGEVKFASHYFERLYICAEELIKKNKIGELLSLETFFGVNLLTKKKFFFFKKNKKIDKKNRKFNKELGGGCILDLGCYTTSLTILISSLIKNLDINNFKIKVLEREIGETGVDIHSKAQIIFENGFTANVNASYKEDFGNNTIIKGKNGEIHIKNTFLGIEEIKIVLTNENYTIQKKINKNIYSEEIENISQNILDGAIKPTYPAMQLKETCINMKILESWRNA